MDEHPPRQIVGAVVLDFEPAGDHAPLFERVRRVEATPLKLQKVQDLQAIREVDLLRTLSNPETRLMLRSLVDRLPTRIERGPALRSPTNPTRARHGLIETTCRALIVRAGSPTQVRALHVAVELETGQMVPYSSVKNAVSRLAHAEDEPIVRVAAGVYGVLGGATPTSPASLRPAEPNLGS